MMHLDRINRCVSNVAGLTRTLEEHFRPTKTRTPDRSPTDPVSPTREATSPS